MPEGILSEHAADLLQGDLPHGVEIIANGLKKGGRLFLVGAGTSGRLGILEAAEMPLTFGTTPKLVRAIMAGGQDAVFHQREGAEDNFGEGARGVARLGVSKRDVIIGVSASGLTQFVRGALTGARKKAARIIFVTCWPGTELHKSIIVFSCGLRRVVLIRGPRLSSPLVCAGLNPAPKADRRLSSRRPVRDGGRHRVAPRIRPPH